MAPVDPVGGGVVLNLSRSPLSRYSVPDLDLDFDRDRDRERRVRFECDLDLDRDLDRDLDLWRRLSGEFRCFRVLLRFRTGELFRVSPVRLVDSVSLFLGVLVSSDVEANRPRASRLKTGFFLGASAVAELSLACCAASVASVTSPSSA